MTYTSKAQLETAIKACNTPDDLLALYNMNTLFLQHDTALNNLYRARMIEVKHKATTRPNRAVICDEQQPTDNF